MVFLRRARHVASVTLTLAFASCALAQSQQPEENAVTRGAQQQPATNPRGTSAAPLIIQVQPTPKTDAETAEEQRQEEQQASDRWLTRVLAITTATIGVLQLVAIGFQVYIARRQNTIIEKQSTIMDAQRAAADAQSSTMTDQLVQMRQQSTLMGLSLQAVERNAVDQNTQMRDAIAESARAADAAATSANTAKAMLDLAHRPKVIVREAYANIAEVYAESEGELRGSVRITNIGDTTATHVKVHALWANHRLTMTNPAFSNTGTDVDPIAPSERRTLDLPTRTVDNEGLKRIKNREPINIMGFVKYRDAQGNMRRTVFAFAYDWELHRFRLVEDRDYSYED